MKLCRMLQTVLILARGYGNDEYVEILEADETERAITENLNELMQVVPAKPSTKEGFISPQLLAED